MSQGFTGTKIPIVTQTYETGSTLYVGRAQDDSANTGSPIWQISRWTETSGSFFELRADGNSDYDNVWDNKEALSYE